MLIIYFYAKKKTSHEFITERNWSVRNVCFYGNTNNNNNKHKQKKKHFYYLQKWMELKN